MSVVWLVYDSDWPIQDDSSAPTLDELGISDIALEEDSAATFQPPVEMSVSICS